MLNGRTTPPVAGAGPAAPTRTLTEAVRRAVREHWDGPATVARGPWPQEAPTTSVPATAEPLRPAQVPVPVPVPVPDSCPVRPVHVHTWPLVPAHWSAKSMYSGVPWGWPGRASRQ
jgi:hypothetical protein